MNNVNISSIRTELESEEEEENMHNLKPTELLRRIMKNCADTFLKIINFKFISF